MLCVRCNTLFRPEILVTNHRIVSAQVCPNCRKVNDETHLRANGIGNPAPFAVVITTDDPPRCVVLDAGPACDAFDRGEVAA